MQDILTYTNKEASEWSYLKNYNKMQLLNLKLNKLVQLLSVINESA